MLMLKNAQHIEINILSKGLLKFAFVYHPQLSLAYKSNIEMR